MSRPDGEYIWITNWEKFQTFTRKRQQPWVPPWIKLYPKLLDNPDYTGLSPETRSLLLGLFMLFARSSGTITKDTRSLSRSLSQRVLKRQLDSLNHAGFIDFCSGTVREQRWNMFWNSSVPEEEVDKKPPKPPKRGKPQEQVNNQEQRPKIPAYIRARNFVHNAGWQLEPVDFLAEIDKFDLEPDQRHDLEQLRLSLASHAQNEDDLF